MPRTLTPFTFCAGEFGELLFEPSARQLQAGEAKGALPQGPQELLKLVDQILSRPLLPAAAVEYGLTALVKLSARFPDQAAHIQVCSEPHR